MSDLMNNAPPQVLSCMNTCTAVAEPCFAHMREAGANWDEFVRHTSATLDKLQYYENVYLSGLAATIRKIKQKLMDHDVADMVWTRTRE